MTPYEAYQAAFKLLVDIRNKHDLSPAGEVEFVDQLAEVLRLYRLACEEQEKPLKRKPHVSGTASRVSEAQRAILSRIKYEGEYRYPDETPTLKALLKKGLVERQFVPPQPGNDYGTTYRYTLTAAGREVVR